MKFLILIFFITITHGQTVYISNDTLTIVFKVKIENKKFFYQDTIYNCGNSKFRLSKDSIFYYAKHQYLKFKRKNARNF